LASAPVLDSLQILGTWTGAEIAQLHKLACLRQLDVITELTDDVIDDLAKLKQVSHILLHNTRITNEGARRLQKAIPNALVNHPGIDRTEGARAALRWALDNGGAAHGYLKDNVVQVPLQKIPTGHFLVDSISFTAGGPGGGAAKFLALPELRALTWRDLNNADVEADHLAALSGLQRLLLSSADITAKGLKKLTALRRLERLQLWYCSKLAGDAWQHLPAFNVGTLHLDGTLIDDQALAHVAACTHLQELALNGCGKVTAAGLDHLSKLPTLRYLQLARNQLTDDAVTPLTKLSSVRVLNLQKTKVTAAGIAELRKALPRCAIFWDGPAVIPGAETASAFPPLDPAWVKMVQAMKPEEQAKEVAAELKRRNSGFDGNLKYELKDNVWQLTLSSDQITDLSPIRAFPELKALLCRGDREAKSGRLCDLSPLAGLQLTNVEFAHNRLLTDLEPLRGMPLLSIRLTNTGVTNLGPLRDCVKLTALGIEGTRVTDLEPLRERKMLLLYLSGAPLRDISILASFPLKYLNFEPRSAEEVALLRSIKTLETINGVPAAQFWKQRDARPAATFTNKLGMKFALVPKGSAWLSWRQSNQRGKKVEMPHDFYLGVYEVTQGEWKALMGDNPSNFKNVSGATKEDQDRFPVEQVSWEDIQKFIKRLNETEKDQGWIYRLPKESEWEYACRGGPGDRSAGEFDFYLEKPSNELLPGQANFEHGNGLKRTCKVGSYPPNRLGLHDMLGNVFELCAGDNATNWFFLGGSWDTGSDHCRASARTWASLTYRNHNHGFRVARVPRNATARVPVKYRAKTFDQLAPSSRHRNVLGMEFARIPKGKAWLGGRGGKPGTKVVDMPHDFFLGIYEVTQEEWQKVTGQNPSWFSRKGGGRVSVLGIPDAELKQFPVESISWHDAQKFLARLNQLAKEPGWVYRLPRDAEWEYACRGGPMKDAAESGFDFYFGQPSNKLLPDQANFGHHDSSLERPCATGSYPANPLGLHDMHDNVAEWSDVAVANTQCLVVGGNWSANAKNCVAVAGHAAPLASPSPGLGLRIARVPQDPSKLPDPKAFKHDGGDRGMSRFTNAIGMKLMPIPAGEFLMGSPKDEADHQNGEGCASSWSGRRRHGRSFRW